MKSVFAIEKKPEKVDEILTSIRRDQHLSQTFEGSAINGSLNGYYTNLALINTMVIGYVKIKGQYDRENGNLRMEATPSNLYWIVIIFSITATTILACRGITGNQSLLIVFFPLVFACIITIVYLLESRSFIKHIKRISNVERNDHIK